MAGYQIIADVSTWLLGRVRGAVCPMLLSHPEQISLGAPGQSDSEAALCVYLYSIRDYSSYVPESSAPTVGNSGYGAPKAISLDYLVFFSNHTQTPLDAVLEQRIFGRLIQLVHTNPTVNVVELHSDADSWDEPASISFQKLDERQKHDLWSGFSEPLRPALYFEVGPLLIRGDSTAVIRVCAVQGEVERK